MYAGKLVFSQLMGVGSMAHVPKAGQQVSGRFQCPQRFNVEIIFCAWPSLS